MKLNAPECPGLPCVPNDAHAPLPGMPKVALVVVTPTMPTPAATVSEPPGAAEVQKFFPLVMLPFVQSVVRHTNEVPSRVIGPVQLNVPTLTLLALKDTVAWVPWAASVLNVPAVVAPSDDSVGLEAPTSVQELSLGAVHVRLAYSLYESAFVGVAFPVSTSGISNL